MKSADLASRGTPGTSGEHSPHDFVAVRQTGLVPGIVVVIWRAMLKWSTAGRPFLKILCENAAENKK